MDIAVNQYGYMYEFIFVAVAISIIFFGFRRVKDDWLMPKKIELIFFMYLKYIEKRVTE